VIGGQYSGGGDSLGVEFGRETRQPLALGVRQELNRHSENATLLTATLLWLVIALVLVRQCWDPCLAGEHLLTLTTLPGPLAFRRWFLGEFVAQTDGAPPTSWDESPFRSATSAPQATD